MEHVRAPDVTIKVTSELYFSVRKTEKRSVGGKKLYIKDWKGSQQESAGLTGTGLLRALDGG